MKNPTKIIDKKIELAIWSIKVLRNKDLLLKMPKEKELEFPTIQASDVKDVQAEFVADPFIILHNSKYYMFFEVLNKKTELGEIGLATSDNGEKWTYESIVLREKWHQSYPYIYKDKDQIYMIPESKAANGVFLYKPKNFPYEWERVCKLVDGNYVDSSVFEYQGKWWMFNGSNGDTLHLFYSNKIEGPWVEHPKSPLITKNISKTRPAGRVIINNGEIYRFAQDGSPSYGTLVRSFKITKLTETDYSEEEKNIILGGSEKEGDWRKNGMHSIDHLKINDDDWLIVTDGHTFIYKNYYIWKMKRLLMNPISSLAKLFRRYRKKFEISI